MFHHSVLECRKLAADRGHVNLLAKTCCTRDLTEAVDKDPLKALLHRGPRRSLEGFDHMRGSATRSTAAILAAGPLGGRPLPTWALVPVPLLSPTMFRSPPSLRFPRETCLLRRRGMSPNIASRIDSIVMEMPADGTSRRSTGRSSERAASSPNVDPESLARAREAAIKDDYEWYMEFIEGNDDPDVSVGPTPNFDSSDMNEEPGSRGSNRQPRGARDGESSRDPSAGRTSYGDKRRGGDSRIDSAGGPWPRSEDQTYNPGRRRRREARAYPPSAVEGEARPRRQISMPADAAYDYDLDDEFAEEPGQGGWAYDPDLTAGVAERRRAVDVSRVRSRARAAAQRRPLPRDLGAAAGEDGKVQGAEAVKEGTTQEAGVSPVPALSPEKVQMIVLQGVPVTTSEFMLPWVEVGPAGSARRRSGWNRLFSASLVRAHPSPRVFVGACIPQAPSSRALSSAPVDNTRMGTKPPRTSLAEVPVLSLLRRARSAARPPRNGSVWFRGRNSPEWSVVVPPALPPVPWINSRPRSTQARTAHPGGDGSERVRPGRSERRNS